MRYTPPPASFFADNRKNFMARMAPGSAAVFFSNDIVPDNADMHYKFVQNSNMYYLTGIDQEEAILFLFPDAPSHRFQEVLFTKKTNEHIQVWEGWKYSKEEAGEASGIAQVKWLEEFDQTFRRLVSHFDSVYMDFNEHDRNSLWYNNANYRFANRLQREYPAHQIRRASPILEELRMIKSEPELEQMKRAIEITGDAFRRVLRRVQPGYMEYEVEAEILHEFIRRGATGPAYTSIVASGANACVLHYTQNNTAMRDGDLLLMDFGAEYGNYSADLSRTIPVNGRFNERQRQVYDAVLRVQRACIEMLRPSDLTLDEYHTEVGRIMEAELIELELLTRDEVEQQSPEAPAYKKYFMHGTSHHIGLDTHDLGGRYTPFRAGMVFTCEPGIYIPEEGFGIRLENDILITEDGPEDLMADIPIEADEIEELMQK